jgi:hypothetical protein
MFIISPRFGLCNQLQTIALGIALSIKYNRNIYINKFQIDLKSGVLTDINNILDLKEMNNFLQYTIKTPIKILNEIDSNIINKLEKYYLPNIDYTKISHMTYINDEIELNKNMEIIYLSNIVQLDVFKSFNYIWDDYSDNNLYNLILSNIKFNQIFYKLKDNIKQELKLTKFNSIHLRIEDDAIICFSPCYNLPIEKYNEKLLNFYNNNIKNLSQDQSNTYICSGMLEFDNKINFNYYNDLMKNNSLLCDKKNIKLDAYYMHNRELIAIIDLLIAYDSDFFVGCHISSFSLAIKCRRAFNNKKYILFNDNDML